MSKLEIIFTVAGIIISIVGIIVVKEARDFFVNVWNKFIEKLHLLWSYTLTRLFIIFIVEVVSLYFFVRVRFITPEIALSLVWVSVLLIASILTLFKQLQRELMQATSFSSKTKRLSEFQTNEMKIINEKWPEFMNELSQQVSQTAVHNLLQLARPYDVNGINIILTLPEVLLPTAETLRGRLSDVEPLLERILGKTYHLEIRPTVELADQ